MCSCSGSLEPGKIFLLRDKLEILKRWYEAAEQPNCV